MNEDLRKIPLFGELDDETLELVASLATLRQYRKNTFVLGQEDHSDAIYFLCEGKARVFRDDEDGNEVTINILQQGQYFGEFSMLSDETRVANVQTIEPTTVVILSRAAFMQCFEHNAAVAWQMCRDLIGKARAATFSVSHLALLDVTGRVNAVLNEHAREENGERVVADLTHQDIAHYVGASRETVSRIIKELRDGGSLRSDGRRIVLLD